MANRKKLRILISFLKDKSSIIKATFSTSIHRAILRATNHATCTPPSDHHIDTVFSLGSQNSLSARTTVEALMGRLHGTSNANVGLKCLFVLHNVIINGSVVLKDQLFVYPSNGLKLSTFRDGLDSYTWELSDWVRWYAAVLEETLIVYWILGDFDNKKKKIKFLTESNSELLKGMDVLLSYVDELSNSPESLHLQINSLVYEIVRLVGEDYRFVQREIFARVDEIKNRVPSFSLTELTRTELALNRLESCKKRLSLLFINRARNDRLWELVSEAKGNVLGMINEKQQSMVLVKFKSQNVAELTQLNYLTSAGSCRLLLRG
ncbi:hypothetical protein ACFE04_008726 [Oxalis oulophora]